MPAPARVFAKGDEVWCPPESNGAGAARGTVTFVYKDGSYRVKFAEGGATRKRVQEAELAIDRPLADRPLAGAQAKEKVQAKAAQTETATVATTNAIISSPIPVASGNKPALRTWSASTGVGSGQLAPGLKRLLHKAVEADTLGHSAAALGLYTRAIRGLIDCLASIPSQEFQRRRECKEYVNEFMDRAELLKAMMDGAASSSPSPKRKSNDEAKAKKQPKSTPGKPQLRQRSAAAIATDLSKLRVIELRAELKKHGLKSSGRKAELVARLKGYTRKLKQSSWSIIESSDNAKSNGTPSKPATVGKNSASPGSSAAPDKTNLKTKKRPSAATLRQISLSRIPGLTPPRRGGVKGLRVLSWNCLHLSEKTGAAKKAVSALQRVIREADFIALQEIDDLHVVESLVKGLSKSSGEWDFLQERISKGRGAGSQECYAFIWRKSAVELVSPGYIVSGEGGGAGAECYFHRPPLVASFRARPSGFVFTAATIHITYSGRKKTWAPVDEAARILELKNMAALAARLEAEYDGVVDRILLLGDFNLPAREKYFADLLGPALGYQPSLDPDVWVSMSSNIGLLPGVMPNAGKHAHKKRTKTTDKLYDNVYLSPALRDAAAGGDVIGGGVINLMDMLQGAMPAGWDLGVNDPTALEFKMKRVVVEQTISDHLPVWCDLSVTDGVPYQASKLNQVKVGITNWARNAGAARVRLGEKYLRKSTVGTFL